MQDISLLSQAPLLTLSRSLVVAEMFLVAVTRGELSLSSDYHPHPGLIG